MLGAHGYDPGAVGHRAGVVFFSMSRGGGAGPVTPPLKDDDKFSRQMGGAQPDFSGQLMSTLPPVKGMDKVQFRRGRGETSQRLVERKSPDPARAPFHRL